MTSDQPDGGLAARRADPRYQRLMEATREAAREGYDAVSMRELAESCHLSMTTIYQFCRSKDHLIAEAHLENMVAFRRRLRLRPPKGATAEERVRQVMRSFAKALETDETVSRTLMRAMYSLDPEVGEARASVGDAYATMIDSAIGDAEVSDREAIIGTLGHVIDSAIMGWLTRRRDALWVRRELEAAVRVLFANSEPAPGARRPNQVSKRRPAVRRA